MSKRSARPGMAGRTVPTNELAIKASPSWGRRPSWPMSMATATRGSSTTSNICGTDAPLETSAFVAMILS